jgi:SAM-dependent methyltransferase
MCGATPLVRCADCDAVFLETMKSPEELAEFYAHDYTLNETHDLPVYERRRMFRLPEQVKLIADLRRLKPPPASLLDIGCDKGFFLDEARRHGYTVAGVEPSEWSRGYCARIGISVVADVAQVQGTFDAVVMNHALEHITDPVAMLGDIHRLLNPGGVVMIRVPDFNSLWSRALGPRWCWFQPHAHYFHYTPRSLRHLLEQSGFDVQWVRSQHPNDRLTKRANRLANRTFGRYFQSGPTLRNRVGRIVEDVTGVELYAAGVRR